MNININELKFDEKGLIPAIVTDYYTKKPLTLAYMNEESLRISIEKNLTCFWSRSRNKLWLKGETSGNFQHIVSIKADCDRDALLIEVVKDGPACHLGTDGCFEEEIYASGIKNEFSFEELYALIERRKTNPDEGSYTSYLFAKGLDKILKKVGEESAEVLIAAKNSREETVYEIADLTYHVMVLMAEKGIKPDEIIDELQKRRVVDKKIKQEVMR